MGAGNDKPLREYLHQLGLDDSPSVPESPPVSKAEALQKAQAILEMAKKKAT
jgi:hypothetical protein